jgi:signal transduction histidine kinase
MVGTVQDTGIGVAAKDLPRIFNQFYRAENAKAVEREGTGLGLSVVKRVPVKQPSPLRFRGYLTIQNRMLTAYAILTCPQGKRPQGAEFACPLPSL